MTDQPEALRVAQALELWPDLKPEAAAARLLREQREEIERLKAERNGFYMDYRVKCDETTKAQTMEIERLREAVRAEREECARVCDLLASALSLPSSVGLYFAKSIRARGET